MGGRYVGIDLHRRRSVIYTMDADGERLECVRITNDPWVLLEEVTKAGPDVEVVIEATYGCTGRWICSATPGSRCIFRIRRATIGGYRRVKNDELDAWDLADLLRLGRLAEAWIAPPAVRELRELVRYRAKLVQLRSVLKAQVHTVSKNRVTQLKHFLLPILSHITHYRTLASLLPLSCVYAEAHVLARVRPFEVNVVGMRESVRVTVRGRPRQHEGRARRHLDATEFGVGHDASVVTPERRIDPAGFLDERRDEPWLASQTIL